MFELLIVGIGFSTILEPSYQSDTIPALKEVIVKTNRMNNNGRLIPFSYTILDSTTIARRNGRSVPELMDGLTGVFIQKTNHGGGSPFVRGLTGNQNLILIDGIRLNNAIFRYGPNQYLTLLDPVSIDRIEVIKGTGSVQYGSDAMGGVINVITKMPGFSPFPRWSSQLNFRMTDGGIENTVRSQINYSSQKFALMASAGFSDFGDLRGGDTTGYQRPSGYLQQSADIRAKWDVGQNWIFSAGVTGVRQKKVPLFHRYQLEKFQQNLSNPLERTLINAQLQKLFKGKKIQQLTFQISRQQLNELRIIQAGNSVNISNENDKVNNLSLQLETSWKLTHYWSMRTGLEFNHDKVFSNRNVRNTNTGIITARRGLYPNGSIFRHGAIYHLQRVQSGKLMLEGGLRYHWYDIELEETTLGKISLKPKALVFLVGGSYELSKGLVVFGNLSSGYRAPNIDDMGTLGIIDFRYEVPSYGLKPEKSLNKELGIRYQEKKWNLSMSIFHNDLNNLINRIKTTDIIAGYNVYIKENSEHSFIKGIELDFRYQLSKQLSLNGMTTYLYGQNITRAEPVRRIPPFNSWITLHYEKGKWNLGINSEQAAAQRRLAQGDKDDNRIPVGGTPGFIVFHAYAGCQMKKLNYRFYLNNLTNADYRKHGSGINGMGRSVTLALQYNFSL
jgi:outer membrane cobalamin receptor